MTQTQLTPIVLVHGILGWGPDEGGFGRYWSEIAELRRGLRSQGLEREVYEASVGPLSSYWDRAHELYYQLVGAARIDFGSAYESRNPMRGWHKLEKKEFVPNRMKKRWNCEEKQQLPLALDLHWCRHKPLNFVGHSMGTMTILVMQYLMGENVFPSLPPCACEPGIARQPDPSWIRSVTSISGVLNGTTATYASLDYDPVLAEPKTRDHLVRAMGLFPPKAGMAFDLAGSPLVAASLLRDLLVRVEPDYEWDLEQWGLSRKDGLFPGARESNLEFLAKINRHPFLYDRDNAISNLTLQGAAQWNQKLRFSDQTLYLSFPTRQSTEDQHPLIRRFGREMEDYAELEALLSGMDGYLANHVVSWPGSLSWPLNFRSASAWRDNDGLVPVVSQLFPWLGCPEPPTYKIYTQDQDLKRLPNQTWHVFSEALFGMDHLDVIGMANPERIQKKRCQFYRKLLTQLP